MTNNIYNTLFHHPGKSQWPCIAPLTMAVFLTFSIGCRKFVEIPPAPNLIVSSQVFADSADANSAVLGMYASIMSTGTSFWTYNGNITLYTGLSSDELYSTTNFTNEISAYQNALLSSTGEMLNLWADTYEMINYSNEIIEGLSASSTISNFAKNQFAGEAKVVRAFSYFHLVNLYGAVPLVLTTDYQKNAQLSRASVDSVYGQIVADLVSAQSLLSPTYLTAGRVRINSYAATALLARVYLYMGLWDKADSAASKIINSGVYSLAPVLNNVFLAGSNEAILQLRPAYAGYETAEGYEFVPQASNIIPSYVVDSFLLNAFEPGDLRRANWLDSNVVNGQAYYYPYKYKLGYDGNSSPKENYMFFRLAEQYLIRSEAEAEGAGGGIAAAISDLNIIRTRAGLTGTPAVNQSQVLQAIQHERQVELFCEWGNRWYDLKRTGMVDSVMGGTAGVCASKGGIWSNTSSLYPIYISQLQTDPFLVQNPGYN